MLYILISSQSRQGTLIQGFPQLKLYINLRVPLNHRMTTLPSFVELMASLGINAKAGQPERACTPSSSDSSPSSSPKLLGEPTPSLQSKSSPSLRDQGRRSQSTRFSPYSSTFVSSSEHVETSIPDDPFRYLLGGEAVYPLIPLPLLQTPMVYLNE